jgi:hypothetical protein
VSIVVVVLLDILTPATASQRTLNNLGQLPWISSYWYWLPDVGEGLKTFRAFAIHRAIVRKAEGSLQTDLFHYLVRRSCVDLLADVVLSSP